MLHKISSFIFLFFLFFYFFSSVNNGGSGWKLPSNIYLSGVACLLISYVMLLIFLKRRAFFSFSVLFLFALLTSVLAFGSIKGFDNHENLFSFLIAFIVIFLYFFSVLQFPLNFKLLIQFLFVLVVIGFLQAFISYIQVFDNYRLFNLWFGYEPFRMTGRPVGSFQQVNMLASFLSLSLISALFLLSLKPKKFLTKYKKTFLYLATFTIFSVLLLSGSRSGFLSLLIPVLCLLFLRYKAFKHNYLSLVFWFLTMVLAWFFVYFILNHSSSLSSLAEKLSNISIGADTRIHLYFSAMDLFWASPWLGYGIGNYNDALQAYYLNQSLPSGLTQSQIDRMTHPHNELLFWMLQSGVVTLIGVVVFVIYYLKNLFAYNKGYGWLILILLAPLVIQSQLSYPFTLSAMHLFLLLILLAFGVKNRICIKVNHALWRSLLVFFSAIVLVVTIYAIYISLKSIKEVFYFQNRLTLYQNKQYEGFEEKGYLVTASNHPVFSEDANRAMESMLTRAEKTHNLYDVEQYLLWAKQQNQSDLNKHLLKKAEGLLEEWK